MNPLRRSSIWQFFISALSAILIHQTAWGSVVITGTRVVYPANARDVVIRLSNEGSSPALVQIWLDNGDPNESPDKVKVPFIVTPPVARIDQNRNQTVRLIYTGEPQSSDREALYWLNMLEIPPKPSGDDSNYLQFAVRTRIKVFYRPVQLKGGPAEAVPKVEWTVKREGQQLFLEGKNPTSYYVTFSQLRLVTMEDKDAGKPMNVMLAPGTTERVHFEDVAPTEALFKAVRYQFIDDYGAFIDGDKALTTAEKLAH